MTASTRFSMLTRSPVRLTLLSTTVSLLAVSCSTQPSARADAGIVAANITEEDGSLTLSSGLTDISGPGIPTDRPALSADGERLVYSVEEGEDPFFILSIYDSQLREDGAWKSPSLLQQGSAGYDDGNFVSWFFPSFVPHSDMVLSGLGTLHRNPDGSVDFTSLASRIVTLDACGTERDELADSSEFGLPFGTLPNGAQLSPDGRYLAFYVDAAPEVQGLYLFDLTLRTTLRLSSQADHDPVWDESGKSLFFHELADGTQPNSPGQIGRVDFTFDTTPVTFQRSLLDVAQPIVSEEHPAPIAGTDLLLVHTRASVDSGPELALRRTCADFSPRPIHLSIDGRPLVAVERAVTALSGEGAAFMGKLEGDASFRIFALSADALDELAAAGQALPCPTDAEHGGTP